MSKERALGFEDVVLIPKYSELQTRKDAHTKICVADHVFKLPVCPSNMICTINEELSRFFSENDYFYIMHRFGDTINFVEKANRENWKFISISVGVKENCEKIVNEIKQKNFQKNCTLDIQIFVIKCFYE